MEIPGGWSEIPTEGATLANQWNQSRLSATAAQQAAAEEPTNVAEAQTKLEQEQTALAQGQTALGSSQLDLQNKTAEQPVVQMRTWEARLAQGEAAIDPNSPNAAKLHSALIQKEIAAGNPLAEMWQDYSPQSRDRMITAYSEASPMAQQSALGAAPFQSALASPSGYGAGQMPPGGAPTAPINYNAHFDSLTPAARQQLGTKLEGIKAGITAVQNSPNPVATFNSIADQLGHPEWKTNNPQEVQQRVQMLAQQTLPATQAFEAYMAAGSTGLPQTQPAPKIENVGGNLVTTDPTNPGAVNPVFTPEKWKVAPYVQGKGGGGVEINSTTGQSQEMSGTTMQARGAAGGLDAQLGAIRKAYPGATDEEILEKRQAMFGSGATKGQSAVVMGETADRLAQADVMNGVIPASQQVQQAAMYRQQFSAMSAAPGTAGAGPTATPGAQAPAGLPPMKVGQLHASAVAALARATTPEQKAAVRARYAQYKSDDKKPLPALP